MFFFAKGDQLKPRSGERIYGIPRLIYGEQKSLGVDLAENLPIHHCPSVSDDLTHSALTRLIQPKADFDCSFIGDPNAVYVLS